MSSNNSRQRANALIELRQSRIRNHTRRYGRQDHLVVMGTLAQTIEKLREKLKQAEEDIATQILTMQQMQEELDNVQSTNGMLREVEQDLRREATRDRERIHSLEDEVVLLRERLAGSSGSVVSEKPAPSANEADGW